jgi:TPP-dependent pyruvate/acetoin dehydrogenase alpha subunit
MKLDNLNICRVDKLPEEERKEFFFCQMAAIRSCEQELLGLFARGLVRGTIHTCLGQEGCAVGVLGGLDKKRDIICSNHRGHGHFLAYCNDFRGLIAEITGLDSGVCGGVGGSQHLHVDNFYSNGILGGMPPVAVGMAAAEKQKNSGGIVTVFLGDGAMAEGSFYEALNIAGLWKLPVMFVVEHNQYAQSTHWSMQHAGDLEKRAETFGVPVKAVDGNRVEEVYGHALETSNEIRQGDGPAMLFLRTYRLGAHSKGEDHRSQEEIEKFQQNDPVLLLRKELDREWCDSREEVIRREIVKLIDELFTRTGSGG